MSQARERLVTLTATVAELEEDLGTARRDLIKSEELSSKHQRDLREVSRGLGLREMLGSRSGPSFLAIPPLQQKCAWEIQ